MGFLDSLRRALAGGSAGRSAGGGDVYWIYAKCRRCGEPLQGRIDLRNEPSLADDGETWIVRKGLMGTGDRHCFQTVEVTLTFDADKRQVLGNEVVGGELITEEEYEELKGVFHA